MENKAQLQLRLERISVFILGAVLFLFPLVVATATTDAYAIPKQALLGIGVLAGIVLLGLRMAIGQSVRLKRTPFDLPLVLFGLAALLSSVFAVNKADSFTSLVPLVFGILLFFLITNNSKREQAALFLSGSLIAGAIALSAITFLSYLKIYILPFPFAKVQTFTPLGSLFDQAIYLVLVLSLCLYMAYPALKRRMVDQNKLIYVVGAFFVLVGLVVTLLGTFTLQKPTILPYQTGFQTAFATISQDNGRVVEGFLMGSGVGTYLSDFTRFKPVSFNQDPVLWNLSFLRSSSFLLEVLSTMGLLGIITFLFLAYRIIRSKPLFAPLILALILIVLVPFSFTSIVLFFVVMALFSAQQGLLEKQKTRFFDVELKLVALKKGVFALSDPGSRSESDNGNLMPYGFLVVCMALTLLLGVVSYKFLKSDYLFQKSLVAASKNDAQNTYRLQTEAINTFPQRDGYHRIFSQINLSLANNLAASVPKGTKPSDQTQQTIYQLVQQSINSARNATTVAPQTALNWQNLSSIYRSLIGFGQNADSFAIVANQQAVALDPNNPQEYINYGGIFYQLGQWDNAIRQFQIAASLKPDFANAYYNLGHALEQKGDLKSALTAYQTVASLVSKDKQSLDLINAEIKALEVKIGKSAEAQASGGSATNQPPLGVDQPAATLPAQNPPVKIPAPKATPTPKPTATPTPTPAKPTLAE